MHSEAQQPRAKIGIPQISKLMQAPTCLQDKEAIAATSQQSFRRLLYMYGAVTQIELNGFLEMSSIDTEERKQDIKAKWLQSAETFRRIVADEAGLADSVTPRPLSSQAAAEATERLRKNPAFVNTFSNFPVSFEEVEIDNLVASQRTVHLDYVEQLKTRYAATGEDTIRFCLDPGMDETSVSAGRTAPNALTFSSENPNLRFLGMSEIPYETAAIAAHKAGGQPRRTVMLLIGYGSPTANVYRIGNRLILNNGFHRLYALRSMGVRYAPVVVQQVTRVELELPPIISDLPREYLATAPRPGLMKDFFDSRLTCEVRQFSFLKAVQVGWAVSESQVPR